jgi:hypothetical protein
MENGYWYLANVRMPSNQFASTPRTIHLPPSFTVAVSSAKATPVHDVTLACRSLDEPIAGKI